VASAASSVASLGIIELCEELVWLVVGTMAAIDLLRICVLRICLLRTSLGQNFSFNYIYLVKYAKGYKYWF
jgi:hypothetical protein